MKTPHAQLQQVIGWLVAIIVPIALLLSAVRLLLTPVFVQVEYRTPNFPEDPYGLTQAQRLEYAPIALAYLLNDEGIEFLGDREFEDGRPLYNERELSHMLDVKLLTQQVLAVWMVLLFVLAGLGAWAWRSGWWVDFRRMLGRGGQVTVILILLLLVYVSINFVQLFTQFHEIFFQGDSWLFLFSDTLIRLFPLRFWQDVFIGLGVLTLGGGAALWWQARKLS